ncbi:hypothetical protein [Paracidovorax cattleyae]|uniref:hypothetical protein n=1 Tax=Paracidovorax cattleyae TaxID=80868 RepID=UPI001E5FEA6B|nr:hypothetical protein [Paracidovorax cattleyae]
MPAGAEDLGCDVHLAAIDGQVQHLRVGLGQGRGGMGREGGEQGCRQGAGRQERWEQAHGSAQGSTRWGHAGLSDLAAMDGWPIHYGGSTVAASR